MGMVWTARQKKVIDTRNKNLLVSVQPCRQDRRSGRTNNIYDF